ncbi:MAG TPA: glycosyltransferase family 9 protein [Gemmatimonadaceae bacterium]|jgi:hypothetical protein|nr:glycosyltransferase family 9 protein [Gemmatimonadaceae bacterium]
MTEPYAPAFVIAYTERATKDPANPLSWYAQAEVYRQKGDLDAWRHAVETAVTMPHDSPEQRWYRAWAQLALGDWAGWADYESRLLYANDRSPVTTMDDWVRWTHRSWDGREDLADKTILVLSEQGMGDNIQMLRFIAPLADRAKGVVVKVYPRLVPFVKCNVDDRVTVLIHGVDKPFAFDRYTSMMSLPHLIGGLPPFVPLRPPGRRSRLPARTRSIRAGLCWAGNPEYGNDANRSMPAAYLAPLLDRGDIEWYSLQVGERAIDADRYPSLMRPWPPLVNFGETADLIAELDVIVSVDTAVAHVAGCLGVPTYLLLPLCSDSRWGVGDRSPWYPPIQLVRQLAAGDWEGVVRRLQHALDQIIEAPVSMTTDHDAGSEQRVLSATH